MNRLLFGLLLALALPVGAQAPAGFAGAAAEALDEPVLGGRVVVYHAGKPGADPVLLVHGLGQNGARDWSGLVPELVKANHEVFALDLPGFGQSRQGDAAYSPQNYTQVLENLVARRIGRPFTLIGHSMGGAICLGYAAAYPQRVRRLVLVDMAGVLYGPVYADALARGAAGNKGVPSGALDGFLRGVLGKLESMPVDKQAILDTPVLRRQILRGDPNTIAAFALGNADFSAALRGVRAPTLLIWGEDDPIAPLRTGQLAAALIKGARLVVLPGVGHVPMAQDAAHFNRILLDELAGKTPLAPYAAEWERSTPGAAQKCDGEDGRHFSGDITRLTLIDCTNVEIVHARIGELRVLASDAQLIDVQVGTGGLYALRSRLQLTGGSVAGTVQADGAELDIAGARLASRGPLVENLGKAPVTLKFSVTEVQRTGDTPRYVHEFVKLGAGQRW